MASRILLVEDDPAIAKAIIYTLERDGLSVTHCLLLGDARRQLALQVPDVLVLDVGCRTAADWTCAATCATACRARPTCRC